MRRVRGQAPQAANWGNAQDPSFQDPATAFYRRNNDKNPFDFKNPSQNTIMGYRVGYEMSKGVSLIWEYSEFYRDDGTGNLEPVRQTKVETAFSF